MKYELLNTSLKIASQKIALWHLIMRRVGLHLVDVILNVKYLEGIDSKYFFSFMQLVVKGPQFSDIQTRQSLCA